ncbi:hypothetical protein lerEdw1_007281 [Lerista edwardsae]|nr:hypothetical protein lerEdw1_007281 [Lerista edwardsae]
MALVALAQEPISLALNWDLFPRHGSENSLSHVACLTVKPVTVLSASLPFFNLDPQGGTTSSPPPAGKPPSSAAIPPSPVVSSSVEAPAPPLAHSKNPGETDGKPTLPGAGRELVNGQKWDHVHGASDGLGTEPTPLGPASSKRPSFPVESKVRASNTAAQAGSLQRPNVQAEVSAGNKADLSSHDQAPQTAPGGESRFALLTSPQKGAEGPPARAAPPHSGEAAVEKESPESPFEVIADKLEFDPEFKEVLASQPGDLSSNWVLHGERELLHDIPEDSVCEFQAKPRLGGRLPPGPGLSRQSSGTTAALEEVSKCVRDLHSFTNEVLNWDLIAKDLDDKPGDTVPPAVPAEEVGGVASGAPGGKTDVGKTSGPPRPLTISAHQKGRPPLGAEESRTRVSPEAAPAKPTPAASAELKADVRWPNPSLPEAADADSSGESDDTIIEDATVDPAFRSEKAAESSETPPKPAASATAEDATRKGPSGKTASRAQAADAFMPPKTSEGGWGFIDDFEAIPDQGDVLGGSPVSASLHPKQSARGSPAAAGQGLHPGERGLFGRGPEAEGIGSAPLREGESFMDFMKECLKAKGRESPEDPVETFSEAELRAARSEVWAPRAQQPPKAPQDFEQEQLTIKALVEAGRKSETERPAPGKASSPAGRRPGQCCEALPDPPAPKSALEKRPLCLEQAIDVKLASTSSGLRAHEFPGAPSQAPLLPRAVRKLLAEFSVHDLVFWRDVKKTGLVFSTTLILLLSLAAFSVISVASYLILALLSVTISFRVYKSVIQAVQKSEEGHPFKAYLDLDVAVSSETFHNYVSATMVHVNHALKLIMRLFLVEDLVDSLKLAVVMWLMTYVGALFNGITLLILAELLAFSVPVVYEKYKTQIDHYVGIAREQIKSVVTKVQAKLPGVVKKKPE